MALTDNGIGLDKDFVLEMHCKSLFRVSSAFLLDALRVEYCILAEPRMTFVLFYT